MRRICAVVAAIGAWIFLSSSIILYNHHIIRERGFRFPLTLVSIHQAFTFVAALACSSGRCLPMKELRTLCGLASLFAINLWSSNEAYAHMTVALIQMLKASTPCTVLVVSFALGIERVRADLVGVIATIALGVWLSAYHDDTLGRDMTGILVQTLAILAESLRLAATKLLLSSTAIAPMVTVLYMALFSLVFLLPVWCATELPTLRAFEFAPLRALGPMVIISNGINAFLLNVASIHLIHVTSALTLNVCGIVKDFLLITYSIVVSHASISRIQCIGYLVSTIGIAAYTAIKHGAVSTAEEPRLDTDERVRLIQEDEDTR